MRVALSVCLVALVLVSHNAEAKKKGKKKANKWTLVKQMHQNLTELMQQVKMISDPVQIHVHGIEDYHVDEHGQGHTHGPGQGAFEETHDHKHEDQGHSHQGEDNGHKQEDGGGTHVHIHFNLPGAESSPTPDHGMAASNGYTYARCDMVENVALRTVHSVQGFVALRQKPSGPLEVKVNLRGFYVSRTFRPDPEDPSNLHGLHVHQYADFQNGCNSFGGHFNPHNTTHGGHQDGPQARHAGDWGNLAVDDQGAVQKTFNDKHSTLFGHHSIIGRGIVIHEDADDLGRGGAASSLKTGDAGSRLSCCIIAATQGGSW